MPPCQHCRRPLSWDRYVVYKDKWFCSATCRDNWEAHRRAVDESLKAMRDAFANPRIDSD